MHNRYTISSFMPPSFQPINKKLYPIQQKFPKGNLIVDIKINEVHTTQCNQNNLTVCSQHMTFYNEITQLSPFKK